ncbi:MAG TPA: TlpA disulfide reductase family protein [Acidobacteriota bacterium]|nr:TlpA disulfide reductase family protein [Acidobacteriota bacterium]HNG95313.1 TlpA disulfide reductase family protein [Acidobacteriota bacterium]HNH83530.1 TlpA disulfide reductase family protein [Acidobacteriota bacterium]HNJ43187.1 TlpA disulfide reductase family protein [Acidobacteriota bacterium]
MLVKDVVNRYPGKAEFVSLDWGNSELPKRYGITKYPVVFVGDVLVAKPEDFGGWGVTESKYGPISEKANQERFKQDLARMIDILLANPNQKPQVKKVGATSKELTVLPDFDWKDIDGQPLKSSELAGKITIVEFWATWCPPCRSTLSWLGELKAEHPDQLNIVGIAIDSEEAKIKEMTEKLRPSVHIVNGSKDRISKFGIITSVPTLYVFDQNGRLVQAFYGAPPDLHAKIKQVLSQIAK